MILSITVLKWIYHLLHWNYKQLKNTSIQDYCAQLNSSVHYLYAFFFFYFYFYALG